MYANDNGYDFALFNGLDVVWTVCVCSFVGRL